MDGAVPKMRGPLGNLMDDSSMKTRATTTNKYKKQALPWMDD
jgi:hypothetical protein